MIHFNAYLNGLARVFIGFYKKMISPYLKPACRFQPTCSEYALECFREFTFLKALYYTISRLLSCHPFGKSGWDPIPQSTKKGH